MRQVNCGFVVCIREIHVPNKIPRHADAFERRNPIIGISDHWKKLMAVVTENVGEVREKNKMNVLDAGVCVSWSGHVTGTDACCF